MEVLRYAADSRYDGRKFRGAIAGAIMKKEVRDYAFAAGFCVDRTNRRHRKNRNPSRL